MLKRSAVIEGLMKGTASLLMLVVLVACRRGTPETVYLERLSDMRDKIANAFDEPSYLMADAETWEEVVNACEAVS
jgi:hypothetical protein